MDLIYVSQEKVWAIAILIVAALFIIDKIYTAAKGRFGMLLIMAILLAASTGSTFILLAPQPHKEVTSFHKHPTNERSVPQSSHRPKLRLNP